MTALAYKRWTAHLRYFYCNRMVSLEELYQVDVETAHWDAETLE